MPKASPRCVLANTKGDTPEFMTWPSQQVACGIHTPADSGNEGGSDSGYLLSLVSPHQRWEGCGGGQNGDNVGNEGGSELGRGQI